MDSEQFIIEQNNAEIGAGEMLPRKAAGESARGGKCFKNVKMRRAFGTD